MTKTYRFYDQVPKELKPNIEYRLALRKRCVHDKKFRYQVRRMCKEDVLFFFNAFVWLYEPRPRFDAAGNLLPTIIPFITWIHQDPVIKQIDEAFGLDDMGIEKSRGEGASWIACMMVLHRWLFHDMAAFGLVSRIALAADNPDDPDSLMWKLDWELKQLPAWMAGKINVDYTRNVSKHVLKNLRNGSTITGYSATGDVASGGRKMLFVMDELAKFPRGPDQEAMDSTGPVSDSRLIISTPKGTEGAYYEIMHSDVEMVKLTLLWKDNPSRNPQMFRIGKPKKTIQEMLAELTKEGATGTIEEAYEQIIIPVDEKKFGKPDMAWVIKFLAKDLKRLTHRGYATSDENKVWSPWYVKQCLRPAATPQSIAQEYDLDYGGSVSRFFNCAGIDRLLTETVKPPVTRGDLNFQYGNYKPNFVTNPQGDLLVWCTLIQGRVPPKHTDYIIGADVASGQGGVKSSNSTLCVVDRSNGCKVAEFASPTTPPEQLADLAIALCMWFGGKSGQAFLIWEDNGYGGQFRNRIFETNFRNFFYRGSTDEVARKKTRKPGWSTQKKSKRELLGAYNYSLMEGHFTNPCRIALQECKEYVSLPGGKIEHISAATSSDPSGAGENHGDRVIADALANWIMYEQREGNRAGEIELEAADLRIPSTSIMAIRNEMNVKERKAKRNYW